MDMMASKTLEDALGRQVKVRPNDHDAATPTPMGLGLYRAPASTKGAWAQLGTTKQDSIHKQGVPKDDLGHGRSYPELG
ncbi:hypothetical protein Syun_009032 [Stephania yunnanensis]|uniref:Uncharacterized protein n=1 Tax=Stephania yunnanensis TaxID=152371 RepID=A0AAP0KFF2_9MAGN